MTTSRLRFRAEAIERDWNIEVDDGHHFKANRNYWIVSVWYSTAGAVLLADLCSPDDVRRQLTVKDSGKADVVMEWLLRAGAR